MSERAQRQMATGERRLVVKEISVGPRSRVFRVYDRARGSYPAAVPGYGVVRQDFPTEQAAQTEADRLTAFYEKEG